jgi:hypothetical protein
MTPSKFELLSHLEDVDAAKTLASSKRWRDTSLRLLMWPYYASIEAEKLVDRSVVIAENGTPVLLMLANLKSGKLTYFDQPISTVVHPGLSSENEISATNLAVKYLLETSSENSAQLNFKTNPLQQKFLSDWQMRFIQNGGGLTHEYRGLIDLRQSVADIKKPIRKSYRSLINWGDRNIDYLIVDEQNVRKDIFAKFQNFHLKIAGRSTRPNESWQQMRHLVAEKRAVLILGSMNDRLVAATYMFHNTDYSLYGTGVYDRELFDKPISHSCVFHSLMALKDRGIKWCDLGNVYLPPNVDKKEKNIALFKKGFTKSVMVNDIWQSNISSGDPI